MTKARANANAEATKGDIRVGSGTNAASILSVGTDGQLLTASSGTTTGLAWAAAPAAGSMTLLSTTTLSGASIQVTGISQSYKSLYIVWGGITNANDTTYNIYPNNVSNMTHYGTVDSGGNANGNTGWNLPFNTASYIIGTGGNNLQTVTINNYASSTQLKTFSANAYWLGAANWANIIGGGINTTSAITSLTFRAIAGSFTGGTALIYGVN